jgi:hypothetical protein
VAFAETRLDLYSIHLTSQNEPDLGNLLGGQPLTMSVLQDLTSVAGDYESFIASLKLAAPELFKRPVLLHHSGSLQFASLERPRVLLFGRGAMLTFAEDPGQADRDIEVLTFDPAESRFEAAEIRYEVGQPPRLQMNPPVCTACHGRGTGLRPLWQPYDIWPGAYGAQAGFLKGDERRAYASFVQSTDKQGIHRAIEPESLERAALKLEELDHFSEYVSSLALLRTMGELKRRLGPLHPIRYALAAALNGCALDEKKTGRMAKAMPISEFLPPALRTRLGADASHEQSAALAERQSMVARLKNQYERYFPGAVTDFSLTNRLDFEAGVVGPARLLLENLGIEWSSFTLSNGENSVSIQMPSLLPLDLGTALAAYEPTLFPEFAPERIREPSGLDWRRFDCGKLEQASLKALAGTPITLSALPAASTRFAGSGLAPMARCMHCHVHETERSGAPRLAFDDSSRLRDWLRTGGNLAKAEALILSGKMPADSRLGREDQDALIESLGRVAAGH